MKKIVLSIAALAALSTGAFAASSYEKLQAWNAFDRYEDATVISGATAPSGEVAAFAVAGGIEAGTTSYLKQLRARMLENPEHY